MLAICEQLILVNPTALITECDMKIAGEVQFLRYLHFKIYANLWQLTGTVALADAQIGLLLVYSDSPTLVQPIHVVSMSIGQNHKKLRGNM